MATGDRDDARARDELEARVENLEAALRVASGRAEHLRVINEFAVAILAHRSLDAILDSVIHNAIANLGFEDCVIYLLDDDGELLEQRAAFGPKSAGSQSVHAPIAIRVGEGIVGAVAASGQFCNVRDTRDDPRYLVDDQRRLSELAVPIVHDGRVIGVIDSENAVAGYYDESHESILTTVASIASTSIAGALGYARLQSTVRQLREAERMQATMNDIVRLANSRLDVEVFYTGVHQAIATLLYAENLYIALYDRARRVYRFVYITDSLDSDRPAIGDEWPLDQMSGGLTDYVVRTGEALLATPEVMAELEASHHVRRLGRRPVDWLGVPLTRGQEVVGVVAVQSYEHSRRYDDADKEVLIAVSQHISMALETRRIEDKLRHDALHDPITGLPNRSCFLAELQALIDERRSESFAVMLFGLDRFKVLNDSLGHDVGDRLLSEVARRLERGIASRDTVARIGGDEFAILVRGRTADDVRPYADMLRTELERVVRMEERELLTSASMGIVIGESTHRIAEELLRDAFAALHQAKLSGRGGSSVFDASMHRDALHLLELESDLRRALSKDEFVVHYQPIVEMDQREVVGFEALARWRHPTRGELLPCDFIQRAHDTGLVTRLDWCVLRCAARDIASWNEVLRDRPEIRISVNLSSHHFHVEGFAERVRVELARAGVSGDRLTLEITENAILDELPRVNTQLESLRELGVGLSVDDFGTGYSSLSYLHQLSVDALKIDRSFVSRIGEDAGAEAIVRAILAMADALGLRVVAEGVETAVQHATLRAMGCRLAQGFYYSRPVDAEAALAMLCDRRPLG